MVVVNRAVFPFKLEKQPLESLLLKSDPRHDPAPPPAALSCLDEIMNKHESATTDRHESVGVPVDTALPFLHTTEVFLYPVVGIIMLLLLSIILLPFGIRVNATLTMAKLYFLD